MTRNTIFVTRDAKGEVLACKEGLSFWGGVDPDTGVIIDAHHPDFGATLAGRIVLMPTSRGSCSGSGVLLQLARSGSAPAALVFREDEEILTLGAMIAEKLFERPVAVLRLEPTVYDRLAMADMAEITHNALTFADTSIPLSPPMTEGLILSDGDRALLDGKDDLPARLPWKCCA